MRTALILFVMIITLLSGCIKINPCPIAVLSTRVHVVSSTSDLEFEVKNVSDKVITAFKVWITAYDEFGDIIHFGLNQADGISASRTDMEFQPGDSFIPFVKVYTTKVATFTVEITDVVFQDGGQWHR